VLTTYARIRDRAGRVMVMLGIADDARVRDLTAEQRGQITDAIAATSGR